MDNPFQLPCEFQYHLIIPSMLTGLQVVWEAYGTPVIIFNLTSLDNFGVQNGRYQCRNLRHQGYGEVYCHTSLTLVLFNHIVLEGAPRFEGRKLNPI